MITNTNQVQTDMQMEHQFMKVYFRRKSMSVAYYSVFTNEWCSFKS